MKQDKKFFIFGLVCFGIGILGGVLIGMHWQQMLITASLVEIAEGLEGTNIDVNIDLNETQLIEGFSGVINQSIKEMNVTQNGSQN